MIYTERLALRKWRPDDAEELYVLAKDPDVGPMAGWAVHTSAEESRQTIKDVLMEPEVFAVTLRKSGELMGSIGLHPCRDYAYFAENGSYREGEASEWELGYWIGKPFWGRGYAPEAGRALLSHLFSDLGAERCWCCHYEGNEKSKRVIEKLGFRYVCTDREHPTRLGITRTSLIYRLDPEDFFRKEP